MDSASPLHLWVFRGLFFGLACLVILAHLLPLQTLPSRVPAPDVLACLALAWILRRPEFVPLPFLAVIFLLVDFFLTQPPGLWAALMVLSAEVVRSRGIAFYEMPFSFEWALVSVVLSLAFVVNHLILSVTLTYPPSLGLVVIKLVFTLLAYPLIVILSRSAFGVRRRHPGEVDPMARRT